MNRGADTAAAVASLSTRPGEPFDPVRLHFLQALQRRTQDQHGAVKRRLEDRLAQALVAYQERMTQASAAAANRAPGRTLPAANGSQGSQNLRQPKQPSALAQLSRQLAQTPPGQAQAGTTVGEPGTNELPELKSIRYFRGTWSRLSVDKQITTALAQRPPNAGPLNSDQLVLRSLGVMRDISPDYLNRFMSYLDTLLWLDQADSTGTTKSAAEGVIAKKRKTNRASLR